MFAVRTPKNVHADLACKLTYLARLLVDLSSSLCEGLHRHADIVFRDTHRVLWLLQQSCNSDLAEVLRPSVPLFVAELQDRYETCVILRSSSTPGLLHVLRCFRRCLSENQASPSSLALVLPLACDSVIHCGFQRLKPQNHCTHAETASTTGPDHDLERIAHPLHR